LIIGFYFAFRPIFVVLAVRILHQDPQFGAAISLALNFLLLVSVLFTSRAGPSKAFTAFKQLPCSFWVLAFLGMSGCSLAWTAAASVPAAIAYWCALGADLGIVVVLHANGDGTDTAAGLMRGYVYGACAISLIAWIMPAQSDMRLGDEELLGPNLFGYVCAFGLFLGQCANRIRPKIGVPWLAMGFLAITLLRSLSKTSIIAFVAGQTFLLLRDKTISRRFKAGIVLCSILVVVAAWGFLSSYIDTYTESGNQAETLTGRLGLWAIILDRALDQPWIGHGFHSVWKVIPPFGPDAFEARHAHNELLQQFYAYGVAGILLLIGLYQSFFRQVRRLPVSSLRAAFFGLLVFVLVRGLTDTEPFDLSLPLWAIVLCSAVARDYVPQARDNAKAPTVAG
jgi:hypothetical protein